MARSVSTAHQPEIWDDCLAEVIDERQLYFIKPGNNVLVPPLNGFKEWVERCIEYGKNTLVIGGCTLNSCVRVSSIETRRYFKKRNLRIVVDLSICGARTRNYLPSPFHSGLSAVESAVNQMAAAGVDVARRVEWVKNYWIFLILNPENLHQWSQRCAVSPPDRSSGELFGLAAEDPGLPASFNSGGSWHPKSPCTKTIY